MMRVARITLTEWTATPQHRYWNISSYKRTTERRDDIISNDEWMTQIIHVEIKHVHINEQIKQILNVKVVQKLLLEQESEGFKRDFPTWYQISNIIWTSSLKR